MNTKALQAAAACYSRNAVAQTNFVEGAKYALDHFKDLADSMPDNHEDRLYVSNEDHEIDYVAKKFKVPKWWVVKIKEECNTNLRSEIYLYVEHELKA